MKLSLISLFVALLMGCSGSDAEYLSQQGAMLGTTYHIKADIPHRQGAELRQRVAELDTKMKSEMSLFDPNSLLSRINRGESSELTPWLERNITLAESISRASGGMYDITVAPLVKAWGFGAERALVEPNIDSLLQFVGYESLSIVEGRIIKEDERTQIDLNSIAKGFAVDRLAEIVESYGSQNYMVEIGGELLLRGVNPNGESWRVGIESPIDGNMSNGEWLERRLHIDVDDPLRAIATSGNYRRFYLTESGEKVVHTIDPRSGRSINSRLLSVTVLAQTCAEADGYATMFMAAGEGAEELSKRIDNCEVYFIYSRIKEEAEEGYQEYLSEGMKSRILE